MMMMWTLPRWRTDVLDVFLFVEHEVLSVPSKSSSSSTVLEEDETPRQRRLFLAVSFVADDAVALKVIIMY